MFLGLLHPVELVTKSLERLRVWLITPASMVELPTYPSPKPTFCPESEVSFNVDLMIRNSKIYEKESRYNEISV